VVGEMVALVMGWGQVVGRPQYWVWRILHSARARGWGRGR